MNRKKVMGIILIIGIILMSLAGYLYYQQETREDKREQMVYDTTTEEKRVNPPMDVEKDQETKGSKESGTTTEEKNQKASTTTEKKQNVKLPDNYEWDEKQWGEPPQIVYDFAENQEKFEYIVSKIDSIVSEGEGFVADSNGGTIYYDDSEEDIKDKNDGDFDEFIEDIKYILKNTQFDNIVKKESGNWVMEYDQDEDTDRYIYTMRYVPGMTEEEAWDNGYIKVVGDWYFATIWKI